MAESGSCVLTIEIYEMIFLNDKINPEDITKWLSRIEPVLENISPQNEKGEEVIENTKAYVADCKHFLEKENLVLAFECMVHAWAILETARELGAVEFEDNKTL